MSDCDVDIDVYIVWFDGSFMDQKFKVCGVFVYKCNHICGEHNVAVRDSGNRFCFEVDVNVVVAPEMSLRARYLKHIIAVKMGDIKFWDKEDSL